MCTSVNRGLGGGGGVVIPAACTTPSAPPPWRATRSKLGACDCSQACTFVFVETNEDPLAERHGSRHPARLTCSERRPPAVHDQMVRRAG